MIADLRFALRQLRRSPGFSAAAIITLALGIGACTAAYSLARGLLWRPLPFGDASRVVVLHGENPARGIFRSEVSYTDLRDLRERVRTVTGLVVVAERAAVAGTPSGAERITSWVAEPGFFRLLSTPPLIGRAFRADEGRVGAAPVALLSYAFWSRRFGRDPAVLGRTIPIDGVPHLVIGVMPASFQVVRSDVWLPVAPDLVEQRADRNFVAVGRLAPGATLAEARAELSAAAASLAAAWPASNRGWGLDVQTYRDDNVDPGTRRGIWLLFAAVAMVLLIACANVAGLMLARGASRARELAVRAAIGASRGRLVRQALAECAVLAGVGGVLGVGLAVWGNDLLLATRPLEDFPAWLDQSIDANTLAVTAAITLCTVFLFGLAPALRASRPAVVDALKGSGGAPGGTRARSALVITQVGLAVVLLSVTALFSEGFLAARRGDIGFDDRPVLSARVFFGALPRAQRAGWMRDALARVRAMPGVSGAALTGAIPGDDGGDHRELAVAGHASLPGEEPMVTVVPSSDGFLDALALTPRAGRWFTAAEAQDSTTRVVVVGEGLARRFWPGGSAIGQRVRALPDTTWLTVVGVVRDLQWEEFGEDGAADHLQLHVPYAREPWRGVALMVRAAHADPAALVEPLQRTARSVHADVPVFDAMTMTDDRRITTAGERAWVFVFGALGIQALLMTAVGLYGLLAFGVAQRRREIGVRVALGARPATVVRMIVRRSLVLTAIGLAVGLVGAAATARVLEGMLWGVTGSLLPVSLAAFALLITALVAAMVPARRAALVDPIEALRAE